MTEQLEGQMSLFDLDIWSGRTSPEPSVAIKEKTSRSSSRKSQESSAQIAPMFLYLNRGGGRKLDASWDMETTDALFPSHGDYTMPSFGEQPSTLMDECSQGEPLNGVSVSRLSQILMESAPERYSLSEKACIGILRRAEKRGKALPEELRIALEQQCMLANK